MSLTPYLVFAWLIVNSALVTSQSIPPNFVLGTELVTRDEAVYRCLKEKHMNLVTIENETKNNALAEFLQRIGATEAYWTSAVKQVDSDWFWLDGEKIKYSNWLENEPNGAKEDVNCIEVFQTANGTVWNDQRCSDKRGYICELKYADQTLVTMGDAVQKCVDRCMGGESQQKNGARNAVCQKACMPSKKFYLTQKRVTFREASYICADLFMNVASVKNRNENTALYNLAIGKGREGDAFWVSGRRIYPGSGWEWGDGTRIKYSNWSKGEPNGNKKFVEYCLEVFVSNEDLEWNDQLCTDKRYVACEEMI